MAILRHRRARLRRLEQRHRELELGAALARHGEHWLDYGRAQGIEIACRILGIPLEIKPIDETFARLALISTERRNEPATDA